MPEPGGCKHPLVLYYGARVGEWYECSWVWGMDDRMNWAPTPRQQLKFSIERLDAWAPGASTLEEWRAWRNGELSISVDGEPAVLQMPPMIRRHTGRLGKLSCQVAYEALGDTGGIPIVFSSRYGDVGRSVDLLSALVSGDELSPTSFSLSVHNAVMGLFAMARRDNANSVALAAGDESAEYGIVEACGLLTDGADRVLLIVADCPLPSVYSMFEGVNPVTVPFAWAGLVVPAREGQTLWLERDAIPEKRGFAFEQPSGLAVLRFLQGDDDELVRGSSGQCWRWSRQS